MKQVIRLLPLILFMVMVNSTANAQFGEPEFKKIEMDEAGQYSNLIDSFNLTGRGLYGETGIDTLHSLDIRARLQGAFGNPTKTLEVLAKQKNFRIAEAIEYEYWFLIDDPAVDEPIPLLVLDIHGPFAKGVTLGAASRYIDLMPQILRTFEKILMEAQPRGFTDYYYEGDDGEWYLIQSDGTDHDIKSIEQPSHIKIN